MYIRNIFVNKADTDNTGTGWSTNTFPIEFGWNVGGNAASRFIGGIPRATVIGQKVTRWFYQVTLAADVNAPYQPPLGPAAGKPLMLATPSVISSTNQPTYYIQVEYTLVNVTNFRTNVDQTYT